MRGFFILSALDNVPNIECFEAPLSGVPVAQSTRNQFGTSAVVAPRLKGRRLQVAAGCLQGGRPLGIATWRLARRPLRRPRSAVAGAVRRAADDQGESRCAHPPAGRDARAVLRRPGRCATRPPRHERREEYRLAPPAVHSSRHDRPGCAAARHEPWRAAQTRLRSNILDAGL